MVVLDTNVVIERIRNREEVRDNITAVTFVEFPKIVYYKKFHGKILFPNTDDFILAHKIQSELVREGKAKTFADLLIASICINRDEELVTNDRDFIDIGKISNLKLKII
ncbi:type II toxin-antitoxin system VapC family toxin [Archaeoglobus veneficus]|uniref:PilT protein domain protein n=1 Tax=Archaeoglobus veneficus (strain DSM 11195 / SNP6) TaxID=693661 RepID=F2KQ83_ARCVS|nr:type II toxin-antitoxin system VapC family toxin [Archaeoglobus veneficus]AEA46516.1 PilT protein domain protein [Archaeoglobus veneficus SNP6]